MSDPDPRSSKTTDRLIGLALLAVAAGILAITSGFVFQALRGPRPVTDQELLAATDPGWGDNYVTFTPTQPVVDTQLVWGKKGNAGTKFVLLPVGDRLMMCSARIADNGPAYVGRLGGLGVTETEVVDRVKADKPDLGPRLMPVMLRTARSIWFDTGVALAGILGFAAGGLWVVFRPRRAAAADESPQPARKRPKKKKKPTYDDL